MRRAEEEPGITRVVFPRSAANDQGAGVVIGVHDHSAAPLIAGCLSLGPNRRKFGLVLCLLGSAVVGRLRCQFGGGRHDEGHLAFFALTTQFMGFGVSHRFLIVADVAGWGVPQRRVTKWRFSGRFRPGEKIALDLLLVRRRNVNVHKNEGFPSYLRCKPKICR